LAFEAALTEAGVSYRANVARNGRMNGYSFSVPGWVDADGAQVWSAASRVSRDLRWAQLRETLGTPDPRIAYAMPARQTTAVPAAQAAPLTARERMAAAARATSTTTRSKGPKRPAPSPTAAARLPVPPQPRRGIGR
jgi:hypothetical protein